MAPRNSTGKKLHQERCFARLSFMLNILLFLLWMMAIVNKDMVPVNPETLSTPPPPTTPGKKITTQSKGSSEQEQAFDGFHPIYVYSNAERAKSEVPNRESVRTNPYRAGFPYAQVWQDKIVLALTKANDERIGNKKSNKFFVDLASNHALLLSNTLHLEQQGWEGLCIEGDAQYWYELARYRTRCRIVGSFVGGRVDGPQADIALSGTGTGIVGDEFDNKPQQPTSKTTHTVKRDLVSLPTVFRKTHVPHVIDYMSLDAEGAESLIMKDFPFRNYTIKIITVERPKPDLVELLQGNGYQFVQKLVGWGETLWVHTESFQMDLSEIKQVVGRAAPRTIKHQNDPYP